MSQWENFDDYMIYNEEEKRVVVWTVYGDDESQYFLSQEYEYEDNFLEEFEGDKYTLVNEEITINNSLDYLIEKTKNMVI